jgi:ankyrin repeat protein
MSSTWIDFIALFDNSDLCEAVYQALLAAQAGGDLSRWNTELKKHGVKDIDGDEDWSSDLLERDDCVLTGEIQRSASSEPREWLSALARLGATGIAAKAFFDQVGESQRFWLINGKRASKAKLYEVLTKQSLDCAFVVAMEQRDKKQVEKLLENGSNPDTRVFGRPAIVVASEGGPQAVVKALVQAGADVNAHDRDTSSMGLMERGGTALHDVVRSTNMVRFLLSAGADVDARNAKGQTPLHLAALERVNEQVFRTLLKAGAEIDSRDNRGLTPLMTLFLGRSDLEVCSSLMKFLTSRGADLEARDTHGGNVLWYGYESEVASLLEAEGLTLEVPDNAYVGDLNTDLNNATVHRDAAMFEKLVHRIGDVSPDEAHSILEMAVWTEQVEFVRALADNGVDVNRRNRDGFTVFEMEELFRMTGDGDLAPPSESSKEILRVLNLFGREGREEERRMIEEAMSFYEKYLLVLSEATTIEDLRPYRTPDAHPWKDGVLWYLYELHTTVPIRRTACDGSTVRIYRRLEDNPGLDVVLVKEGEEWKVAMERFEGD